MKKSFLALLFIPFIFAFSSCDFFNTADNTDYLSYWDPDNICYTNNAKDEEIEAMTDGIICSRMSGTTGIVGMFTNNDTLENGINYRLFKFEYTETALPKYEYLEQIWNDNSTDTVTDIKYTYKISIDNNGNYLLTITDKADTKYYIYKVSTNYFYIKQLDN